ncbi:MAG: class IV adenylate cyclase [Desulfosarcina sp.]|jgi:adenylate cyclase class 2
MEHLEIELKFSVHDVSAIRRRLLARGAVCTGPRAFEHNVRYEAEDERLLKNRCLLRLRKDRQTTLTFKSPLPNTDTRFKVYRELEVHLNDFDTMDAILQSLGFIHRQIYEKYRETWQLAKTTVCVDRMPFGDFLEIEGAPDAIMGAVQDLGLAWGRRIRANYLGIFDILRKQEGLAFNDVTFANFKDLNLSFDRYRHRFEADGSGMR